MKAGAVGAGGVSPRPTGPLRLAKLPKTSNERPQITPVST